METIHQYINETPDQLKKNFENRNEILKPVLDEYLKKDYQRIVFITCGSTLNACNTAKYYIEHLLKVNVDVIPSYTFENWETVFRDDAFYVGMGQSGRSSNTNNAMSKVLNSGYQVIGVSGNADSEMKNHCNVIVDWNVGIEKIGFVTKGYATAAFFWMIFALEAGLKKQTIDREYYNYCCEQLEAMIEAIRRNIPIARKWVDEHEKEFFDLERLQIIAVGPCYGAACEGSLKMEEVLGKGSSAIELEEFLHGPCYELCNGKAVYLIDGNGHEKQRVHDIFNNIHTLTDKVYMVSNVKYDDDKVITLDYDLEPFYVPLVNALVLQCVAANVHAKWQNPNLERRMAFIESLGVKAKKTGKEVGL